MRGIATALVMFLFLTATALSGAAEPYGPERPIEIIVPYPAGGGLDIATRVLAKYAEPEMGQNIVISNKSRGANLQGNLEGIRAAPDGHVLVSWGNGLVTDELVIKNAPYTHLAVRPVCLFANDPEIIVVGRDFAVENNIFTLKALIEYARGNPGQVTMGVGGNWTTHDFMRLKIEGMADVRFNRMPFLGGALSAKAAAEGNCHVTVLFLPELLPYLDSGKLIPLAVAHDERIAQLPDLPTTIQLGYPEMTQTIWRVLTVPKDTPAQVVSFLESAFKKAAAHPGYIAEARSLGVNPISMGAEETDEFIEKEYKYYREKTEKWGIRTKYSERGASESSH